MLSNLLCIVKLYKLNRNLKRVLTYATYAFVILIYSIDLMEIFTILAIWQVFFHKHNKNKECLACFFTWQMKMCE